MSDEGAVLDMCCGTKRCPVLTEIPEGFRVQDGENVVVLTREQAERAAAWLVARLYGEHLAPGLRALQRAP